MGKYDCSKTIDFFHEMERMCNSYPICGGCPLIGTNCGGKNVTKEQISAVQKWSDEHPEKPKLTKKDRAFIDAFVPVDSREIKKDGEYAYYIYDQSYSMLVKGMFENLAPGTKMNFEELMKLEVEDE